MLRRTLASLVALSLAVPTAGAYALLCCRIQDVVRTACCCPTKTTGTTVQDRVKRGRCCDDGERAAPRVGVAVSFQKDKEGLATPTVVGLRGSFDRTVSFRSSPPASHARQRAGPPLHLLKSALLI